MNWNPFIFVGYRNDMSFPHTNPYISPSPIMALDFEYYTTMQMFADAHISSLKYLCYNLFKISLTPIFVWPLIVLKIFCNFSYRFLISFSLYKSLSSITKYFYWFFFCAYINVLAPPRKRLEIFMWTRMRVFPLPA